MILALVAAVTVTFSPARPAVGDPITLRFGAPAVIDRSSAYEIVSQRGSHAVVRTFEPRPIVISGRAGNVRFRNLIIPVHSVLAPNDDLKPAPLVKPQAVAYPRAPLIAMAIAALAAAMAWVLVWWRARSRRRAIVPVVAPADQFRERVLALRGRNDAQRWADLADATRAYLAASRPQLGSDLTTTELLPRLESGQAVVVDILRQGDLEKFSPWGAESLDFDIVAARALELAS